MDFPGPTQEEACIPHCNSRIPRQLEKNNVVPPSSKYEAPVSYSVSRDPRIFPTQGSSLPLLRLLHHKWILYHLATREALYCPEGATDIISGRNCSFVRKARSIHYTYEREGPCCLDERVCHCEKDRKAGTGTMALS